MRRLIKTFFFNFQIKPPPYLRCVKTNCKGAPASGIYHIWFYAEELIDSVEDNAVDWTITPSISVSVATRHGYRLQRHPIPTHPNPSPPLPPFSTLFLPPTPPFLLTQSKIPPHSPQPYSPLLHCGGVHRISAQNHRAIPFRLLPCRLRGRRRRHQRPLHRPGTFH